MYYEVCDPEPLCNPALLIITVTNVNDIPAATNDVDSTLEDITLLSDVQANDMDPDGDALTTSILSLPSNGTAMVVAGVDISYTPAFNFNGNDTIEYEICDGSGACDTAWLYIVIEAVNDAPTAVADVDTTNEDQSLMIKVQLNDSDIEDDPLKVIRQAT